MTASMAPFVTVCLTIIDCRTAAGSPASNAAAVVRSNWSPTATVASMRPMASWNRGSDDSGAPRFAGVRSVR